MKEGKEHARSEKQATRCRLIPCARYPSMMSGCSYADRRFLEDGQQRVPLWNPKRNPDMLSCLQVACKVSVWVAAQIEFPGLCAQ